MLRLMAGGYSNREIARAIHKSEGTVKNQVSSILDKLVVRDRTQAVLRAINLGLLLADHFASQPEPIIHTRLYFRVCAPSKFRSL